MTALVRLVRPLQWVKNLLVFAAPVAAGEMLDRNVAPKVAMCFVAMCCAASATYVINDWRDAEADRLHPIKKSRPIAAGQVTTPIALLVALVLVAVAVMCAASAGTAAMWIVIAYAVISMSYSAGIKRIPVVEMVVVASGFVLRGLAGAAAGAVPVSPWFFVVLSAASILVVAAKRSSELQRVGSDGTTRSVLASYSSEFLSSVQTLGLAVALIGYCLWAFDSAISVDASPFASTLFKASVAPFATALLRFLQIGERGEAGAPEELLRDPIMLGCALVWGVMYGTGILMRS